ncbi:MAG: response regulator transcription factor [Actinomycetaceae bacterium]|nr:response regulator transcription factor [Actinomycetaceae bacterium]
MSEALTLLVVDDHPIVRAGIISELAAWSERIRVVGQAATVEEAITEAGRLQPEVVLLDVHLPGGRGGGGAEVARAITTESNVRVLALSVSDAAEDVVSVIRAGARGYVTKSVTIAELVDAIERVAAGDAAFSPRLAGFVLDAFGTSDVAGSDAELDRLTARELEVMRWIARGYTYKEAAAELYISVKTVESHVSRVLRKLQLSNRNELTHWASRRRLI